jgi:S1-C subfamily serine protease
MTIYLETQTTVGDTAELTVLRDGKELTVSVRLGELPQ